MLNTWKNLKLVSLVAVMGSSLLMPAGAADKPKVREGKIRPIDVIRINPSKADVRKAKQKEDAQVHAVKLYIHMPPPSAEAYVLYIGDAQVEEYGSFAEGIFFKAYDREDIDGWRGKPVRFVVEDEVIDLGILFPAKIDEPKPGKLPDIEEALGAQ